ncbi:MAG: NAD(P)H-hydrate dehydratase [Bacteroidales bacterium]|nr:NAD(P)H-hydrate dehydratase [Bacteroidales bacterium]
MKENKIPLPDFLVARDPESHKGDYGHALLLAGSIGKIGAAVLAARGCLRAGVGLLTVCVPRCGLNVMQTAVPEAMVIPDPNDDILTTLPDLTPYDAIAIGPGIGTGDETFRLLDSLCRELSHKVSSPTPTPCTASGTSNNESNTSKANSDLITQQELSCTLEQNSPERKNPQLVLDADALNLLATHREQLLPILPSGCILTPHMREFERLISGSASPRPNLFETSHARETAVANFARRTQSTVVLKGHRTIVAQPDGQLLRNSTGNAGMATAGSGDVLTGIVLGLSAQQRAYAKRHISQSEFNVALTATYLHGLAGDLAAKRLGMPSMLSSDLIEFLPQAIRHATT